MEIMSQQRAKELQLPRYFTGKPCKYGHTSERQTGSGTCLACKRLKRAEQRKQPEIKAKYAAKCREYRATDHNRLKANEASSLSKKNRVKTEEYRLAHNKANCDWRKPFMPLKPVVCGICPTYT